VINTVRAVAPGMRERGHGRIVNVASVAAHGTTMPGNTFYAATKAEVVILTRRFAMELGPRGITVNAVAPGFIPTDMTQGQPGYAEMAAQMAERAMVRRVGHPDDIAFLAAPESGFITGQTLTVDGGRTTTPATR
jgi:3-oxoacyl-[acyl-carrier protein] reductase